jgi:hypothetical protein
MVQYGADAVPCRSETIPRLVVMSFCTLLGLPAWACRVRVPVPVQVFGLRVAATEAGIVEVVDALPHQGQPKNGPGRWRCREHAGPPDAG